MYQRKDLEFKNVIFDLDGTIIDSMTTWDHLGREYLLSLGLTPCEDLNDMISSMTLEESAHYFKETYHLNQTVEELVWGVHQFIREEYEKRFQAKEYIKELVVEFKGQGKRMCVLTTTEEELAMAALKRLKMDMCFEKIYTSQGLGLDKRSGEIYVQACRLMNFKVSETMVFEDAVYAVRSAKDAGCLVTGVFDLSSKEHQREIMEISDDYISESKLKQAEKKNFKSIF